MSDAAAAWARVERLLCVRLDALGDVIMTGPALRALKRGHPGRHVTLLTSPAGASVGRYLPGVDEVLVYEAPWVKATPARARSLSDRLIARHLRQRHFEGAVIFTVYSQSALPAAQLCYLADIPRRLAHCRENPYQLLTDWIPDPEPHARLRHEVRRRLDLVRHIGALPDDDRLRLLLPPEYFARARRQLQSLGLHAGMPWVVLHPGATAPSRRYPASAFAAAARQLVREHGCAVVFTGSAAERALVERVRRSMDAPSYSLAGQLSFGALCGLIAHAPVLVSNN